MTTINPGTKVILHHRHYGEHTPLRELWDATPFSECVRQGRVNEQVILALLPDGFLPVPAKHVLLTIGTRYGSVGQDGLAVFRNWAKYFDAYVLEVHCGE